MGATWKNAYESMLSNRRLLWASAFYHMLFRREIGVCMRQMKVKNAQFPPK